MGTPVPKPFLKWAGGKRWLLERAEFRLPEYGGRYIEPFLGGGAVFFHLQPNNSILADSNLELVAAYQAIKSDWRSVERSLLRHQSRHSDGYYYEERARTRRAAHECAARFIYLNRACWNGLYRVNLSGRFNVPRGTKDTIIFDDDDFEAISRALSGADIRCADFSDTIQEAQEGDLIFIDPPYTAVHNYNGFLKYNQNIFCWNDQLRLKQSVADAVSRGAYVIMTNAAHSSIEDLYCDLGSPVRLMRQSVISGRAHGRAPTEELLFVLTP